MSLHITNWATRRLHGTGTRWTIMANPRWFEKGRGAVPMLMPLQSMMYDVKAGRLSMATYRQVYEMDLMGSLDRLRPGQLISSTGILIADGDSLLCCCSMASAEMGECHRVWAACQLVKAGWGVILDGTVLGTIEGATIH